jgi:hypothetical protein
VCELLLLKLVAEVGDSLVTRGRGMSTIGSNYQAMTNEDMTMDTK